jgi:anthranilate/para-aminobenzoate synthase component I
MTIRTIVLTGNRATIGVGGGITIDSIPLKELEETKLKAQALLRALGAADPWLSA